jgi:LysM repeat protein
VATLPLVMMAACGPAPVAAGERPWAPPPVLSAVAILAGASPDQLNGELAQLAQVPADRATPSEALIVSLPAGGPDPQTYVVRSGDTLQAIAEAHHVPLAVVEDLNPQLGALAGRSYNLIHAGDQVNLPAGAARPAQNLLVTRAPSGPPPPSLIVPPAPPKSPTDFQRAQWKRSVEADQAINQKRIAAWRAAAAKDVVSWQAQVASQIHGLANSAPILQRPAAVDLSAAIQLAATTLRGLPGRHVLVLLGPAGGPPAEMHDLAGVHLVVANLEDGSAMGWTSAGGGAGATVTTLTSAASQLQLPSVVNG